jgi:amidase
MKDPARRALLKPEAVFEYETGRSLSGLDVALLADARADWTRAFTALFEHYDYLIAPTAQVFAFDAALTWPRTVGGKTMRSYHEWMATQCLVTLAGCPSLAVPGGYTASGQSMGLQLIAPVGKNAACFALAAAHEAAAGASVTRRLPPKIASGLT